MDENVIHCDICCEPATYKIVIGDLTTIDGDEKVEEILYVCDGEECMSEFIGFELKKL